MGWRCIEDEEEVIEIQIQIQIQERSGNEEMGTEPKVYVVAFALSRAVMLKNVDTARVQRFRSRCVILSNYIYRAYEILEILLGEGEGGQSRFERGF